MDISKINSRAISQTDAKANIASQEEEKALDIEQKRQAKRYRDGELAIQSAQIKYINQTIKLRNEYHPKIHVLIMYWLGFDIAMILASIIFTLWLHIQILPSSVLNTLIGSTTIAVVGLFAIVLSNIFPKG